MVGFFKKINFIRNVSMGNGELTVFGTRMQLVPCEALAGIVFHGGNGDDIIRGHYITSANMTREFIERSEASPENQKEAFELTISMSESLGWGHPEPLELDLSGGRARVSYQNSSVASSYLLKFGRSEEAVCHFLRGGIAGALNAICMRNDLAALEMKCAARGDDSCEFVVAPKEELLKEFGGVADNSIGRQLSLLPDSL